MVKKKKRGRPPKKKSRKGGIPNLALLTKFKKYMFFDQKEVNSMIDQPVLYLIYPNNEIELIEGVSSGIYEVYYKERMCKINLTRDKLLSMNWGDGNVSCWICYVEDAIPYPHDVLVDSRNLQKLIAGLVQSYKDIETTRVGAWSKLVWIILGGIALVLAVIYIFGDGALPGTSTAVAPALETINETINVTDVG